ncbi:MAG: Fur family transcriptional regulator [Candidatus Omnitrophica bacterium]|nr:Fur family transcriptional regulator [Candidatus Omnitrophota bacterium]
MNKKTESLELFVSRCRENNLKLTPQRTAIYKELISAIDHPSTDIIHKRVIEKFPHISLDTVNRTVLAFADLGIIKVVEGYGKPKRFDPDIENHHHFHCVKCNRIIDFKNDEYDELNIPSSIFNKYIVFGKKVVLEGICDRCRKKK